MSDSYVSLTTFRKDGTPVATPVWFATADNHDVVIRTAPDAGKVKRIRNNPRVTLTPCDVRGRLRPGAPTVEATARLLDRGSDEERAAARLLAAKYWMVRIIDLVRRNRQGLVITATPA
jgi:PPOX class probable F420-dependent enzyme